MFFSAYFVLFKYPLWLFGFLSKKPSHHLNKLFQQFFFLTKIGDEFFETVFIFIVFFISLISIAFHVTTFYLFYQSNDHSKLAYLSFKFNSQLLHPILINILGFQSGNLIYKYINTGSALSLGFAIFEILFWIAMVLYVIFIKILKSNSVYIGSFLHCF